MSLGRIASPIPESAPVLARCPLLTLKEDLTFLGNSFAAVRFENPRFAIDRGQTANARNVL